MMYHAVDSRMCLLLCRGMVCRYKWGMWIIEVDNSMLASRVVGR